MSKLRKLDFAALNVSGDNYWQWESDTRIMLGSKGLGDTITKDNNASDKDKYRAICMIRHHLCESLKDQYLTENPLILWNELKKRYDQKAVLLIKTRYEWMNLRIQDFKSVDEYNSAMLTIVSKLKLCGEEISDADMLEKTYTTFHTSNVLLQQQHREKDFKTYSNLISYLLLAEKNSELRSPGSAPLPDSCNSAVETKKESNDVQHNNQYGNDRRKGYGRGRGNHKTHGRGRGRGNSPGFSRGRGRGRSVSFKRQNNGV